MKIRIAGIEPESIVDGIGIRYVVFMQGCNRHCKGCHNPETHQLDGGRLVDTEDIIAEFKSNPLLIGITLTGGEPLLQIEAAKELAKAAKKSGLTVWCYTGFKIEEIPIEAFEFLNYVDVLVDGEYVEELKNMELNFCGSTNQRIINLNKLRELLDKTANYILHISHLKLDMIKSDGN